MKVKDYGFRFWGLRVLLRRQRTERMGAVAVGWTHVSLSFVPLASPRSLSSFYFFFSFNLLVFVCVLSVS
ncbi:hypothetical protein HanRHA438_Chr13g0626021 [Helianthus annuus]|nr:hypothetical protein HanIR_Chr13g0668091 [Helianthus annuus]KAJ0860658.1 hypothetical protein HanRHA438_Chr13g0626021 [Helianthus annuus]